MRRAALAGALLCAFTSALVLACDQDSPTEAVPLDGTSFGKAPPPPDGCVQPGRPAGTILGTVPVSSPWGVAVRDDGLTYFTQLFENGVGITSTATRTVDGFVPTGFVPTGIAFSPDGNTVYVGNQDATVSVIDVASRQVTATYDTEGTPVFAVQVSPEGDLLFAGGGSTTLYVLDVASGAILNRVTVGHAVNAFAVAPDNRILYVSAFADGTVTELDIYTQRTLRTFAVGGTPQGVAINRRGTRLYVANEQGYLNDIDLRTGVSEPPIPLAGGGFGVGVTPDDNQAYITIPGAGVVQIFGLQNRRLAGTLRVDGDPRRIAFSRAGKVGAITNAAGYLTFIK
jgi:YVTN family beta-propeller protein